MHIKRAFLPTISLLVAVFLFVAGCGSDDGGNYDGIGKLLSDRHRARLAKSSESKRTEGLGASSSSAIKEKGQSGGILFEEEVKVVGVSSGRVLAKGTAYLDKKGAIVNIRIRKK